MEKKALSLEETFSKIGFGRFHVLLVILCGIIQSFDAIEMLILAFLGPILSCSWKISVLEESFLSTSVFIGAMCGGILFGHLSDTYGRKSILLFSSMMLIYIATLSTFSPLIEWLLLSRSLVGLSLGGIMVSLSTLTSELLPIKQRGTMLMIILGFWSAGSYFVTTMSMVIVPNYGWRMLLLISVVPLVLTIPLLIWIPESPRFLLLRNRKEEAIIILNKIANINKCETVSDVKESEFQEHSSSSFIDLLHPNYISTTICVNILWIVSGVSYYSIILLVIIINDLPRQCGLNEDNPSRLFNTFNITEDNSCCRKMTWDIYKNSYISTTGELIFLFLSIIMMSLLPRKLTMALFSAIITISFAILNLCLSTFQISILLLIIRGSVFSVFNIDYIYTSEVFPTSIRSLAMGLCFLSARIGAIMSPFLVNMFIMQHSFVGGTLFLSSLNFLSFIVTLILPYETKSRKLYQTAKITEDIVAK